MKKKWLPTIILAAVLVALVLVWAGVTYLPGTDATETTATTAELPVLSKVDAADVASVVIRNESGELTLLPTAVIDDGVTKYTWSLKGVTDLPLDASALSDLASLGTTLYGGKKISDGESDLKPFGLDNPKVQVIVRQKNGESHTISFGNELASGYFDYAIIDGAGAIYSVSSSTAAKAEKTVLDLIDGDMIVGVEAADLTGIVFDRAKDSLHVAAASTYAEDTSSGTATATYTFKLSEPIAVAGSADRLTTLATEMIDLEAAEYVEINPADLAVYGLDQPSYTITLQTADSEVTLKIGKMADDSHFYVISSAVPVVFKAAASSFTTIDMPFIEMIDRLFALKSIWLVSQVKVDLPGAEFTTNITMDKSQKATDESVSFTLNGLDAKIFSESDKNLFTSFYQRIIGMRIAGADAEAAPVNTHDGSVTFVVEADDENNNAAYTEKIEFTKRDDYTYYVFIDDVYTGYYVDGRETFTSDETGLEGIVVAYKKMMYAIEHAVDGVFNTEEGYQLD